MKLSILIPRKPSIKSSIPVKLAPKGKSWYENSLKSYANKKGVYVICHGREIKYVGKTTGESMSFGMRLRRHFQETAAGKHTYPRFKKLNARQKIRVSFFSTEDIRNMIHPSRGNDGQLISIFEAALINAWNPVFQRNGK